LGRHFTKLVRSDDLVAVAGNLLQLGDIRGCRSSRARSAPRAAQSRAHRRFIREKPWLRRRPDRLLAARMKMSR
jgi:hypothetical protein